MSGPSDNPGGPSNEHPTAAERRIAELEAQLRMNAEYQQHELETERTNAEHLHQALDSVQVSKPFAFFFHFSVLFYFFLLFY